MGRFTIFKGRDGQYYFNLKASNGEIILQSEGYTAKANCRNGVDSVKENSKYDSRFMRKSSISNQYYFVLVAANGQPIGKSQMYSSRYAMEIGIQSVKANAPVAPITDLALV